MKTNILDLASRLARLSKISEALLLIDNLNLK